ncbi:hypothetical protein A2U01_0068052, partial [Trifolium medium]|nr:hypothetical protein [Trifolium medium]
GLLQTQVHNTDYTAAAAACLDSLTRIWIALDCFFTPSLTRFPYESGLLLHSFTYSISIRIWIASSLGIFFFFFSIIIFLF